MRVLGKKTLSESRSLQYIGVSWLVTQPKKGNLFVAAVRCRWL